MTRRILAESGDTRAKAIGPGAESVTALPSSYGVLDVLLGRLPDSTIVRLTGLSMLEVRRRRQASGVERRHQQVRAELRRRAALLATRSDGQLANQFDVSATFISAVRCELGVRWVCVPFRPGLSRPRLGTPPDRLRTAVRGIDGRRLERALARLDQRWALILRRRVIADRPVSLRVLGKELSLTQEGIRQIELKAIRSLAALLGIPGFLPPSRLHARRLDFDLPMR